MSISHSLRTLAFYNRNFYLSKDSKKSDKDSHILKIEKCIRKNYDEVALDHFKKILSDLKNTFFMSEAK